MKNFNEFKRLFSRQITLRFELIPQGLTRKYIETTGLLDQDQHRADSYKVVKKIVDEYHKRFITRSLSNFKFKLDSTDSMDSLSEYLEYYNIPSKTDIQKKQFSKIQDVLRKSIARHFEKDPAFANLFKEALIKQDLLNSDLMRDLDDDEKSKVKEFMHFTTYFKGFHENRKNMYSDDAISTAIAFRLIHENLPKFIDNLRVFEKLAPTDIANQAGELLKSLSDKLAEISLQEVFSLSYFNRVLTQEQIDTYNAILGGKVLEDGTKIRGLNELVNLYNQHSDQKLPLFKLLFKQILSDRVAQSWLPEKFQSDNEVQNAINEYYDGLNGVITGNSQMKNLLQTMSTYDLSRIYIKNDKSLTDMSQKMFGDWHVIENAILADVKHTVRPKRNESEENYSERLYSLMKKNDYYSIRYINDCIDATTIEGKSHVEEYFAKLGAADSETVQRINVFAEVELAYAEAKYVLKNEYPDNFQLSQDVEATDKIKRLLDSIKNVQRFIKPLLVSNDKSDKDERFYGELSELCNIMDDITPLYNKVRNYMTRKPYSQEKVKLNFGCPTLLNGWDLNKERANKSILLRKDGLYYLGIMNKSYSKIFDAVNLPDDGECYSKMEYKLVGGAMKMFPKVFFSKSRIAEFAPSEQIMTIYNSKSFAKSSDNFSLEDCHTLIDFYKASIAKHPDWSKFNHHFSPTSTYEDINGFFNEFEEQSYKLTFRKVSSNYVDSLVEEGKLYLFQIYNKDFSPFSKGTPNLHTIYWKMLFDERNLANVVYKLNGEAEIFFRKKSNIKNNTIHPAHQTIKNKNVNNPKPTSLFDYALIKDRRYTVDKFQFHVPITLNFKNKGVKNLNDLVYDYLKQSDDTYVIGIDRGERNLLYYSLIDSRGNIAEQGSLNTIGNFNYLDKLNEREVERENARESWKTIENIKDLKEGYLSQAIHKIAQLMIKYQAIVVLEDLNVPFMRSRQKFERQVYQKFEKTLIDKLNYLVDKKIPAEQDGGLLNAYQLTNEFKSFKELGKRSGFLFYVPAWNTSKIDPTTGFVNMLDTRYETVDKARTFFNKFQSIRYNQEDDMFEFAFDYNDFHKRAEATRTQWTVCTYKDRIEQFCNPQKNNSWDYRTISLTDEFKTFFASNSIDINGNLKEQIVSRSDKSFFVGLLHLLKLTLQMRNSNTAENIDYLISPVRNKYGEFFDSNQADETMPKDADANGAYNIALKGLWAVRQIKKSETSRGLKLAISNKEWLNFVQEKPYLND